MSDLIFTALIQIAIYVILSVSLNLLVGYVGLLSIGHAALCGIGGYVTALVLIRFNLDLLLAMVLGALLAALVGVIVALPSLRLKGDYFFITTMGFQMIMFSIFMNWMDVTRGPLGLYGIPRPHVLGMELSNSGQFLLFCLIIAALCVFLTYRLSSSPFGLALKGIREDEVALEALGKNITRFKVCVFAFSAVLASIAGALYASFLQAIDPYSFTLDESVFILTMVILGGSGKLKGSIIGACTLVIISEGIRYLNIPMSIAFQTRQIIYGLILVLFMMYRPQGILGEYKMK